MRPYRSPPLTTGSDGNIHYETFVRQILSQ